MAASLFQRLFAAIFRKINSRWVWYRLPLGLAVPNLFALRIDLQWHNLFDTEPVSDGKLHLNETGHLPLDPQAADKDPQQELAAVTAPAPDMPR